jgi:beta-lactamase class A
VSLGVIFGGVSNLLKSAHDPDPATTAASLLPSPEPEQTLALQGIELEDLEQRILPLTQQPDLTTGVVLLEVETGSYASLGGSDALPSASVIKVPILVAFFQAVDQGRVKLDEVLVLKQELMAEGSGTWQQKPVGTQVSALAAATQMIMTSDNTATNLLIERLGGIEQLNQSFSQWGLRHTQLSALLPDLAGTNTTSAMDMATLLSQIEQGNLLSRRSRDRMLDIMRRTVNRTLLPQGLGYEARIAHKTGDIRSMVGDVGIIDMPNGHRYIAAVLVKRAVPNDEKANQLIRKISETAYQYWLSPAVTAPAQVPTPAPTTSADS